MAYIATYLFVVFAILLFLRGVGFAWVRMIAGERLGCFLSLLPYVVDVDVAVDGVLYVCFCVDFVYGFGFSTFIARERLKRFSRYLPGVCCRRQQGEWLL